MRFYTALLALLIFTTTLWAQRMDTIAYSSAFERNILTRAASGSPPDPDALLFAIGRAGATTSYDPSAALLAFRLRMPLLYQKLDKANITQKPAEKQVKTIFDLVHKELLFNYDAKTFFADIFETGSYNCLTASALFALIFDHYQISYEIKEAPGHVYLVAYPRTLNFRVETTLPGQGFQVPSASEQRQYVELMMQLGRITQEQVEAAGVEAVFNEVFYSKGNLSLQMLGALQYYNQTLGYLEAGQYEKAFTSIRKSKQIADSDAFSVEAVYAASLAQLVVSANFQTDKDLYYLAEFTNTFKSLRMQLELKGIFTQLANLYLSEKKDLKAWDRTHEVLQTYLESDSLRKDVKALYHFRRSLFFYETGNMTECLKDAEAAHLANPNNLDYKSLFITCLFRTPSLVEQEPDALLADLDGYASRVPMLTEDPSFQELYLWGQTNLLSDHIQAGRLEMAGELIKQVELRRGAEGFTEVIDDALQIAYQNLGEQYYRKKQKTEALYWLQRGLELYPRDSGIKDWIRLVQQY